MTKEEILLNLDNGYIIQPEICDVVEKHNALIAMDIWAKEVSIGFANFVMDKTYQDMNVLGLGGHKDKWVLVDTYLEYTTDELYSLYLKSIEKTNT